MLDGMRLWLRRAGGSFSLEGQQGDSERGPRHLETQEETSTLDFVRRLPAMGRE